MRIGLNPYGLTYTTGLQPDADGVPNPRGIGARGFVALAHELGARCVELDSRWVLGLDAAGLQALSEKVAVSSGDGSPPVVILSHGLTQQPDESLIDRVAPGIAYQLAAPSAISFRQTQTPSV